MRTRDEHCPPHVHVEDAEDQWEARLAFSFISDVVRIRGTPGTRTINRIKTAIEINLPVCLDNRWLMMPFDGMLTVLPRRITRSIQIRTAACDPRERQLTLIAKDGTNHVMPAGAGAERLDP
jgi:hypothetical protein